MTGELAVLLDGPRGAAWRWRDALTAQAGGALGVGHYQPTDDWVAHPTCPAIRGRVWRYQPPAAGAARTVDTPPPVRRVLVTGVPHLDRHHRPARRPRRAVG